MKGNKETVRHEEMTSGWITTWSQAQRGVGIFPINDNGYTLSYTVPVDHSGEKIRLIFDNYYSNSPLAIRQVAVFISRTKIVQEVSFDGMGEFVLPPHSLKKSDPLTLSVEKGDELVVRLYYPEAPEKERAVSGNTLTLSQKRSTKGNFVTAPRFPIDDVFADPIAEDSFALLYSKGFEEQKERFGLTLAGVDVLVEERGGTIVAFGDSITEQSHWVTPTKQRVLEELGNGYSLVNAGISGNRLLREIASFPRQGQFFGLAATQRFLHDSYEKHENVVALIVALGVNDIHQPGTGPQFPLSELPTFDEMVAGFQFIIDEAKKRHTQVYLATITPFIGYAENKENEEKEALRQQLNEWIRGNSAIDGVYDFDKIVASTQKRELLAKQYDSGDKLHPSSEGGQAMSACINVRQWKEKQSSIYKSMSSTYDK